MRLSPTRVAAVLSFACLPITSSTINASILVTNLDQPFRGATPIANPVYWGAQSFSNDGQFNSLSWIDAMVGNGFDDPATVLELRSADIDGNIDESPAGLLTTFTPPDLSGALSTRVFAPDTQVTLQPGAKYWFVVGCSNAGGFDLGYINTGKSSGTGTILDFADSVTGGQTWDYRGFDFPYYLQVNVEQLGQQWNLDGDGDWSVASNWIGGAPNAIGAVANFTSVITADRTVTVDADQTVGQINFDNANRYSIAGANTLTINGAGGAINVVSGSHDISAPLLLASDTSVDVAPAGETLTLTNLVPAPANVTKTGAGKLSVNVMRMNSLTISAGTLRILPDGTDNATTHLATLTIPGGITPTATLDLEDNDMILKSTGYNVVRQAVRHARNGGAWDQTGITSSAAASATPKNKTLGILRGSQYLSLGNTTFNGFAVANNDTLVKFTYYGDTDLNGLVDFDDYARTDAGFNTGATDWFHGDFDYSGSVDFDDYSLIDLAFNTQSGTLRQAMSYLDGTDRSEGRMTAPALRMVVEHYEQFGQVYATGFLNAVPEPTSAAVVGAFIALSTQARPRRARAYSRRPGC